MPQISPQDKRYLLKLARTVIESHLKGMSPIAEDQAMSPVLLEKSGCFVTLHLKGQLRGCIGVIEPIAPLVAGVRENAVNSAFRDPRFSPVTSEELEDIVIEISVLAPPRPLTFQSTETLISLLQPGVHGVILSRGYHRATFLPQVWEQLPRPEDFLSHLCRKAGMSGSCWKDAGVEIEIYEVMYFSEESAGE